MNNFGFEDVLMDEIDLGEGLFLDNSMMDGI